MIRAIDVDDLTRNSHTAVLFEGANFDSTVSFFVIDAKPGFGPSLHKHPYEETFIVQAGEVTFTVADETAILHAKQMVVVPKEVPHKFINSGTGNLQMISINPCERVITEWLTE